MTQHATNRVFEGEAAVRRGRRFFVSRAAPYALSAALLLVVWIALQWPESRVPTSDLSAMVERLDGMALVYPGSASDVEPFFIDRYEVTNADYAEFLRATGYRPDDQGAPGHRVFLTGFESLDPPVFEEEIRDHPVVAVSARDAEAYADWAGKSLPLKDQWWSAAGARSTPSSDPSRSLYYSNCLETGIKSTTRVGTFESGKSDLPSIISPAVYDLYGNVWEWSATLAEPMRRFDLIPEDAPWLWWWTGGVEHRPNLAFGVSFRNSIARRSRKRDEFEAAIDPGNRRDDIGFRCVLSDARGYIRRLLDALAEASPAARIAACARLSPMGEPLSRLIDQMRFDSVVAKDSQTFIGSSDRVEVLRDGRVVVLTAGDDLLLIDPSTGEELDRREDIGSFQYAAIADTDSDGVEELYCGVRAESQEGRDLLYEVVAKNFFHLRMTRPGSFDLVPLAVDAELADELWKWASSDLGIRLLVDRVLDRMLDRGSLGDVARLNQRLHRIDLTESGFEERYEVELPLSVHVAVRDDDDRLFVPGMLWVRHGDQQEPILMDAHWLSAETGEVTARGLLPGRFAAAELFGDDALVLTGSGHVLRMSQENGSLRVTEEPGLGRTRGATALELLTGPGVGELTLLRVEEVESEEPEPPELLAVDGLRGRPKDLVARVMRLRTDGRQVTSKAYAVTSGARARISVEPVTGTTLLYPDPYEMVFLDRSLTSHGGRVERGDLIVDDLRRPIGGHFLPGYDRPQIAVAAGFPGIAILDATTGEELEKLRAVHETLLGWRAIPARRREPLDRILTIVQLRSAVSLQIHAEPWFVEAGSFAAALRDTASQ